jgi:hypothetical protein
MRNIIKKKKMFTFQTWKKYSNIIQWLADLLSHGDISYSWDGKLIVFVISLYKLYSYALIHVTIQLFRNTSFVLQTFLNQITYEEFEDTKEVIRIRISKKNRQHNDQKKKYKRTNNDLQNTHIKLKIE